MIEIHKPTSVPFVRSETARAVLLRYLIPVGRVLEAIDRVRMRKRFLFGWKHGCHSALDSGAALDTADCMGCKALWELAATSPLAAYAKPQAASVDLCTKKFAACRLHFLGGGNAIVPVVVVFHEGDALALDRVGDDGRRLAGRFEGRLSHSTRAGRSWPSTSKVRQPNARHLSASGSRAMTSWLRSVACHLL